MRIDSFAGVNQGAAPHVLEQGQLQNGQNLGFYMAGKIQTIRGDTYTGSTRTETMTDDPACGMSFVRLPDGRGCFIGKVNGYVVYMLNPDDVESTDYGFNDLYESDDNTPVSAFTVDDWIYIYDGTSSKKWDGDTEADPLVLVDITSSNDLSGLNATLFCNASQDFLKMSTSNRTFVCLRDCAMGSNIGARNFFMPAWIDATPTTYWRPSFDSSPTRYWLPVAVHETEPSDYSSYTWAGSVLYHVNDKIYLHGTQSGTTASKYYEFICAIEHTSLLDDDSPLSLWNWLSTFFWAEMNGETQVISVDGATVFRVFPDWTSNPPDDLSEYIITSADSATFDGNEDYVPLGEAEETMHGYDGNYYYQYRYVIMAQGQEGQDDYPIYSTDLQELNGGEQVTLTKVSWLSISYDKAPVGDMPGYGTPRIQIYRSKHDGGSTEVYLLADLDASSTEAAPDDGEFYDTVGDVDLGSLISSFDIDFLAPPQSSLAAFCAQRVFIADDNDLWWSFPGYPDRFSSNQWAPLNDSITAIAEKNENVYIVTPSDVHVYRPIDSIGQLIGLDIGIGTSYRFGVSAGPGGIYIYRDDGIWLITDGGFRLISTPVRTELESLDTDKEPILYAENNRVYLFRGPHGVMLDLNHNTPLWSPVSRQYTDGTDDDVIGLCRMPSGKPYALLAHPTETTDVNFRLAVLESTSATTLISGATTQEFRYNKPKRLRTVTFSYSSENDILAAVKVRNMAGTVSTTNIVLADTSGATVRSRHMLPFSALGEALWVEFTGINFTVDGFWTEER